MSEFHFDNSKKVVVKKGTDILTSKRGRIKSYELRETVDDVWNIRQSGWSTILVASGATASGLGLLRRGGTRSIDLHTPIIGPNGEELSIKQALSAIGQPELFGRFSSLFDNKHHLITAQFLLTHLDFINPERSRSTTRTIQTVLALGAVPILNGNDPTSAEGFYYDNDMITADTVVAMGVEDVVMYSSAGGFMVDGQIVPEIRHNERESYGGSVDDSGKSERSSGGMESKFDSIGRMTGAGATVHLVGAHRDARLANILDGSYTGGTVFLPAA